MKTPWTLRLLPLVILLLAVPTAYSQDTASRDKTRERLNTLLTRVGPELKVTFQQSTKNPYNFAGSMKDGLTNCESLEIVMIVTENATIGIRVFPHYSGGYINVDKARNPVQLLRKLAQLNYSSFLFWGADDTGDVFTGYTFTLESGFPDAAITIVLESIKNADKFVGQMKPSIDGSSAP